MINKLHYEISHDGIVTQVTYNSSKKYVHLESFCPSDEAKMKDHDFCIPLDSLHDLSRVIAEITSFHEGNQYLKRREIDESGGQQQYCQPLGSDFINKVVEWERKKEEAEKTNG